MIGQLAGLRNGDGWFRPVEVDRLLEKLRVPPGNTSRALGQLEVEKLVLRRSSVPQGNWSLTPLGNERVLELIGEIDPKELEPQLADLPGAEFGHELHTLIPPSLAPVRWATAIERLLKEYPFESNVFCMTRFPEIGEEPLESVIAIGREALQAHGLTLHLASDRVIDEDLLAERRCTYVGLPVRAWSLRRAKF